MKKLLLATTALVSAAAIVSTANAQGPDVTVGGFVDVHGAFRDQDVDGAPNSAFSRDGVITTDAEVHVNVEGKSDNGLTYGAVIELQADTGNDEVEDGGGNADKTYIYLESNAGRVELGDNVGAEHSLKVDASTIARAGGGIDSDITDYINVTTATNNLSVITTPDLWVQGAEGRKGSTTEDGDASKLTYFTPRVSGFQAGASYTRDTGDIGGTAAISGDAGSNGTGAQFENVFSGGLTYQGQFDNVGLALSATGEIGEAEAGTAREDLEAWALGGQVDFAGFSVAGSYGDLGDSGLLATTTGDDDQTYWTAGAAYETGPFGVSVTYLESEASTDAGAASLSDEFQNLVIGADYQLAPGLTPYIEASFFELDDSDAGEDNDGTVFLVGTTLNF